MQRQVMMPNGFRRNAREFSASLANQMPGKMIRQAFDLGGSLAHTDAGWKVGQSRFYSPTFEAFNMRAKCSYIMSASDKEASLCLRGKIAVFDLVHIYISTSPALNVAELVAATPVATKSINLDQEPAGEWTITARVRGKRVSALFYSYALNREWNIDYTLTQTELFSADHNEMLFGAAYNPMLIKHIKLERA